MQNKQPKLGINIKFFQNFLSIATFYPNTIYLQLPHSKEAFWVDTGSEKYEKNSQITQKWGKLSKFLCCITHSIITLL